MSDVLLTVKDVALILQCSQDSVIRRFAKVAGVIDLGLSAETSKRFKRRYRVLRIPKAVVEQYLTRKSGRSIQIEVPLRADRRRKSAVWEDRAILSLAKAAKQNDCQDNRTFERIARRARLLTNIPEDRWTEIVWFDEE